MKDTQSRRNFVFLALGPRLKSRVDGRFRIRRRRQLYRPMGRAKRVARIGVFQLHCPADVASAALVTGGARCTLAAQNTTHPCSDVPTPAEPTPPTRPTARRIPQ